MYGKNCAVKKSDYEKYSINLPFKFLLGKRRKKFIFKELEKLHPCFSDEYCFDSKILYKNWKFFADVLVMNKMKLASYRFDNPRCKLHTEENEKRIIFNKHNYLCLIFLLVFICCIWIAIIYVLNGKKAQTRSFSDIQKDFVEVEQNMAEIGDVCNKLFETVKKTKGVIKNFSWENKNSFENLILSVDEVFAEEILIVDSEVDVSSINYLNNVPNLRLRHGTKVKQPNLESVNHFEFLKFISRFRNLLIDNQCKITEESNYPFSIKFSFSNEHFEDIFEKISTMFKVELFFCPSLSITKDENVTVELTIENDKKNNSSINPSTYFNIFEFIWKNSNLFFTRKERNFINEKKLQNKKNQKNGIENEKIIIGKIIKNGEQTSIFYKNYEQKICLEKTTK